MTGTVKERLSPVFRRSAAYFPKISRTVFAFLLTASEARCGVYPFGFSLLCGGSRYDFQSFIGCFTGCLFNGYGPFGCALSMIVYALKWLAKRRKGNASYVLRLVLSVFSSAAIAAYGYISGGTSFVSVLRVSVALSLLPLMTSLFALYEPFSYSSENQFKRELSLLAWVFAAAKAAEMLNISDFRPSLAVCVLTTLYLSRENPFFGSLCGFASGLACGIVYIPVLTIAGLAYGIFVSDLPYFALFFSLFLSLSSGVYLASISGAFPEFFNIVFGFVVFGFIYKRLPPAMTRGKADTEKPVTLKKMSQAFSSLSEVFETENYFPSAKSDLSEIFGAFLSSKCEKCRLSSKCRIDKYDYVNHLTEIASSSESELPGHITEFCPCAATVSGNAKRARRKSFCGDENKLLSDSCRTFARLLCTAGENSEGENVVNPNLTKKAAEALEKTGLAYRTVTVRGRRLPVLRASGDGLSRLRATPKELKTELSKSLGVSLSEPEFRATENGWDMIMRTLPSLRLEYGKASRSKSGETVSGDTSVTFESDDMRFYSLIADGMGSGKDASSSSHLASLFMEKIILAGGDKREALSMLNKMLLVKKNEVFTTVDLLEIDRVSGDACVMKAGAAPSFLLRDGKCVKIESNTPPAGVINDIKVTLTELKLKKGDVFVMTSDGVAPDENEIALSASSRSASVCASSLLENGGAGYPDDMSVCVVRAY